MFFMSVAVILLATWFVIYVKKMGIAINAVDN